MQLQSSQKWNDRMESVLHIAGTVIAECHFNRASITRPILQSLLFYTQGWHEIFFDEPCFNASFDTTSPFVFFPAVENAFQERNGQLYTTQTYAKPTEDKLIGSIVASYGQGPVAALLDQTSNDVHAVRQIKIRKNLNTSQAFKEHFTHLATPGELRTNQFHGLFVDTYRAKKFTLVDWTPPREPTPEEIAEFDQIQIA